MLKPSITALAIVFAAASPAVAGDFSVKVDRELLESRSGAEKVMKMIERKIDTHCEAFGPRSIADRNLEEQCKEQTMRQVIKTIDNSNLSAAYSSTWDLASR